MKMKNSHAEVVLALGLSPALTTPKRIIYILYLKASLDSNITSSPV